MSVLWPLWYLESAVLLLLWGAYYVQAPGALRREPWAAWTAGALASYLGAIEVFQMLSYLKPLFGDPGQGRLADYLLDWWNPFDIASVVMVFVTVTDEDPDDIVVATTLFLLLIKVIGEFRSLEAFGFLVTMLLDTIVEIRTFVFLLVLMLVGFAFIFESFIHDESLSSWLWAMYRLGFLGDFESALYYDNDPGLAVPLFVFITLATSVIMLNVLITIVGDCYICAKDKREQLGRRIRATTIIDLEAKYLWPWTVRVTRRGKPCSLVQYPAFLVRLAGFNLRPTTNSAPDLGHLPGSQVSELELVVDI